MKAFATANLIVAPIFMQIACILSLRPIIALLADPSRSSQKVSPIIDFFTSKWSPEYWYFCMIDLYRRTIVTGAVYFSSEPQMSLYIAVFLNFFYTILYREGTHELIQQGISTTVHTTLPRSITPNNNKLKSTTLPARSTTLLQREHQRPAKLM